VGLAGGGAGAPAWGTGGVTGGLADLTGGVAAEREGYALAAGFALGLVTLGSGRRALGLADLRLEEQLR
jgi:anaphase-promoting complex subunit 1